MKKLILIIIALLLYPDVVRAGAEIYYSDYSEFSKYIPDVTKSNDLVDIETKLFYKWYKEVQVDIGYFCKNCNTNEEVVIDESKYKQSEYSEWSLYRPEQKEGRIIGNSDIYYIEKMKKIKYLHFVNLKGSMGILNINELDIKSNDKPLSYTIYCEGCSDNFSELISDGNLYYGGSNVKNGGYFRLELDDYYDVESLTLKISMTDLGRDEKKYEIITTRDESFSSNHYNSILTKHYFTHSTDKEYLLHDYNFSEFLLIKPEWEEPIMSFTYVQGSKFQKVVKRNEYRYSDLLYRYYKLSKIYYEDYVLEEPNGYPLKDGDINKQYSRSRHRDKVTIKKDIVITSDNDRLEDFIIGNTTNQFEIEGIVNYSKNGKYKVVFKFPFINVLKEVIVNIEKNDIVKRFNPEKVITKEVNNKVSSKNDLVLLSQNINNDDNDNYNDVDNNNQEEIAKELLVDNGMIKVKDNVSTKSKNKIHIKIVIYIFLTLILIVIYHEYKKASK